MRVAVLTPDEGACSMWRLRKPGEALAAQGADVSVGALNLPAFATTIDGTERILDISGPDADVVVIQRPLDRKVADAVEIWRRKGLTVVVDLDDHFHAVHPDNVAARHIDRHHNPGSNTAHLARALRSAHLVTVTTPALADFYSRFAPCAVVPNQLPDEWLDVPPAFDHTGVWVGWTGTRAVHPTDLEVTEGAVGRAVTEGGAEFSVIGDGRGVAEAIGLNAPINQTGLVPLDQYPALYACLDVAIAPVADTDFNRAKSSIKVLEASALAVPCVASPMPDYRRVAAAGCGLIARRYADWHREIARLIASPDHRAEIGGRSRQAVAQFTISRNTDRWWSAWTKAHRNNKNRSAA